MKVKVKNKTYEVKWRHVMEGENVGTRCLIFESGSEAPCCIGQSLKSDKDQFSRPTGRKVSFSKALEVGPLDMETRTEFWDTFNKRFPPR